MFRTRTRHTFIAGVALASLGALAGCSSASSSASSSPTSGSTATAGATGLLKTILADRTLTVGESADPPFSFQNANGSFVGITPQLAADFAAKLRSSAQGCDNHDDVNDLGAADRTGGHAGHFPVGHPRAGEGHQFR